MNDMLLNTLIQSATAVVVGVIGVIAWDGRRKTIRIRNQVENDHETNFREEQDERHAENQHTLNLVLNLVTQLRSELNETNKRVDSIWRNYVSPRR